jgi:4-aminobutyrate aminotransferase-like enzyme
MSLTVAKATSALKIASVASVTARRASPGALGLTASARLKALQARYPRRIAGIRGIGAMIAFDLVDEKGAPDSETTKKVTTTALQAGLMLLSCGVYGNTIDCCFR